LIWAATVALPRGRSCCTHQSWFGGRRGLAVALMTVLLLLILVVPLYFAITTITGNVGQITEWSKSLATLIRSPAARWVEALPLVGARLATSWRKLAPRAPDEITAHLAPSCSHSNPLVPQSRGQLGCCWCSPAHHEIAAILYGTARRRPAVC